jgi:hypothetical protein
MADLSLSLQVFIASSAEVKPERDVAREVILGAAREAAQLGLLLYPFCWEHEHYPASDEPQPPLTEHLRHAELVVVLFWTRVGAGSRTELEVALAQARRGETDNVAIYFKTAPTGNGDGRDVLQLRRELTEGDLALSGEFATTEEFGRQFAHHLRLWLRHWDGVPACCQYAMANSTAVRGTDHLGDNRLLRLERMFDLRALDRIRGYLAAEAVKRWQQHGVEALRRPLCGRTLGQLDPAWESLALPAEEIHGRLAREAARVGQPFTSPSPLLTTPGGDVGYADFEWFAYFSAVGLAAAIREGRIEAVALRPYANPIHQFLSAHVRREGINITDTLIRWLTDADGRTGCFPVARNFAAYVLGMIGAVEAQDALAETMSRDDGEDVVTYCITSLGKLRARRYLERLVRMFQQEADGRRRLLLSQAVSNIVGITRFDL